MPTSNYPSGWHQYVKAHHKDTAGYVVAQTGDCLKIRHQETTGAQSRVTGRGFQPIHPRDLPGIQLAASWFMGVIFCPGDDLSPVLAWITHVRPVDHGRIVLYIHPAFDQVAGAKLMRAANLDHIRTTEFRGDWTNFHHLFGNDHAWQVWHDKA